MHLENVPQEKSWRGNEIALMCYAGKLTREPGTMIEEDIIAARQDGARDEEILEVNQSVHVSITPTEL